MGLPEPLKQRGITMHLMVGNHDAYYKNTNSINAVEQVKNIRAVFDKHMSMDAHINTACRAAWLSLYNISKIRQYLTTEQNQAIMHAFVTARSK